MILITYINHLIRYQASLVIKKLDQASTNHSTHHEFSRGVSATPQHNLRRRVAMAMLRRGDGVAGPLRDLLGRWRAANARWIVRFHKMIVTIHVVINGWWMVD